MSLARIPFSEADHGVIRTLNGWMIFLAIVHFVVALVTLTCGCMGGIQGLQMVATSPLGGSIFLLQMSSLPILGAVMLAEGVLVLQARSALARVVETDFDDQVQLSTAFRKLKLFFVLELVWFGVSMLTSLAGLVVQIVAPDLLAELGGSAAGAHPGGGQ